jgi:putative ABC transport system permease protein
VIRAGIRRVLNLALRRRDRWEREVEEEIKLHIALRAEQLVAQGATPDEAFREAVRKFGSLVESRARLFDAARHREARMQRTEYLGDLRQDIGFALRSLGRQRTWTAVALLTFALGIGATTAVFSVVSALLLHLMPYPNADRIVYVAQEPMEGNKTGISVSIVPASQIVTEWMRNAHSFETFETGQLVKKKLKTVGGDPSEVGVASVFPTFVSFSGQHVLRGRMFTQADIVDRRSVALLGEGMWRTRFAASDSVLGKVVTLGDSTYQIIGVLPSTVQLPPFVPKSPDFWIPFDIRTENLGLWNLVGRLRPGVTVPQAERELDSVWARSTTTGKILYRARITTPSQRIQFRDSLVMLSGAVALVLLVACANVAHLLLARSASRQRELAIRAALGAGRGRLLRQLLTESLLLTGVGAAFGIAIGWAGLELLVGLRPAALDSLQLARLDSTTLAIAIGVAVASGVLFGILGVLQSARSSTNDSLKASALSSSHSRRERRLRGGLVVSEMALSATLIVGAVMLVRSVVNLQRTDLGFTPHGLYAVSLPLDNYGFRTPASRAAFVAEFMRRARDVPSVVSASLTGVQPGSRWFSVGRFQVEGEPLGPENKTDLVDVNSIQSAFFATMRIPLKEGTVFSDTTPEARQVIVNAGFARKHWPAGSAVGHRVRVAQSDSTPWYTIVGVAGEASTSGPMAESSAPMLYTAYDNNHTSAVVLVRTNSDAKSLAPLLDIARTMGIRRPQPLESVEDTIRGFLAGPRFIMMLLTAFTLFAVALAAIGLYGVMSHRVAQDTREIGIRVALGASASRIGRTVVARGLGLTVIGVALGLGGARWATKIVESQLHGVSRLDPASFVVGATVLIAISLIACVVPMRRALAVDPMTAIRVD